MSTRRRAHLPPLTDPDRVRDVFASGFDVHDEEDWLRLIGWAVHSHDGDDGSGNEERRKAMSLVVPRSAVRSLMEALRHSLPPRPPEKNS
jgi:hypothetical protein